MSDRDPGLDASSSTEGDSKTDSSSASSSEPVLASASDAPTDANPPPKVEEHMRSFSRRMSRITMWPDSDLTHHLVRLELEWNELTVLPASISSLKLLEYLSLNHNDIHTIEEGGLTDLTTLKHLDLSSNALTTLPPGLSQLTNLTYLTVSKNRLTEWPTSVHELKNLETLGISSNAAIRGLIPDSFGEAGLDTLTTLRLGELGMNEIPDCLAKLTNLTNLDLEINSISAWPDSLVTLQSLKRIDLMLNDFAEIPRNLTLELYPGLLEVSLIGNPIGVPRPIADLVSSPSSKDLKKKSSQPPAPEQPPAPVPTYFRFGFVASPNEVVPGVYLGSIEAAYNKHRLRELGVTHIVSLVEAAPPYPLRFNYLLIEVPDIESTDLLSRFDESCRYIDSSLKNGACLIHCQAGMSRSATITIAWVMKNFKLRYNDAHDFVREKRPIILPNAGFIEQLEKWEMELERRGVKFGRPDYNKMSNPPSESKCIIS